MREEVIFTAGEIIGMLSRFSRDQWHDAAANTPGLHDEYRRAIQILLKARMEIFKDRRQDES